METIKVFEAFAGYGSQSMALDLLKEDIGLDYEVVGISEIDPIAIKAYYAARDPRLDATGEELETVIRGGTSHPQNLCANTRTLAIYPKSTGRTPRISISLHTVSPVRTSAMPDCKKVLPRGLAQGHPFYGSAQELSKQNTPNTS